MNDWCTDMDAFLDSLWSDEAYAEYMDHNNRIEEEVMIDDRYVPVLGEVG